ncbi:MAG: hypothetical protein ACI4JR_02150 [Acutalibacteraceae bacterium]
MKKIKLTVSLLLALVMMLSSVSTVFAAGNGEVVSEIRSAAALRSIAKAVEEATGGENVVALEAQMTEYFNTAKDSKYYGVYITSKPSKPTDETYMATYNAKAAEYEEIVKKYKALSESEKDAFDIVLAGKLLNEVTGREAYLITVEDPSTTINDARNSVCDNMSDYLGKHTARDNARKLAEHFYKPFSGTTKLSANINFSTVAGAAEALDKYVADYKASDKLTRAYLDCVSVTGQFTSAVVGSKFKDLVNMMGNRKNAENPSTVEIPKAIAKPNAKNYAGGETDPEYIAALNEYLVSKEANLAATAEQNNHKYAFYAEAMAELIETAPEYANAVNTAFALRDGYVTFRTTGKTDKAESSVAAYDALSENDLTRFKGIQSIYAYYEYYLNSAGNDYAYSNMSYSQFYKKCQETAQMALVQEFENWVMAVDLDRVTNATVAEAQDRYGELPSSLISQISPEAKEKYDAIIALYDPVKPLTPSEDKFEDQFADFRPTSIPELKIPFARNIANAKISTNDKLLAGILNNALAENAGKDADSYTIFANDSISSLLPLYNEIVNMNLEASGINISKILAGYLKPSAVAAFLVEEKFSGAREKLLAAAETDDTTNAYATIAFEDGDWGFTDGDKEGFKEAVAAMLRPVADILHNGILIISQIISLPNTQKSNGDYVYGAYEELIPLFEALGLKGVISSEEYSARFYAAQKVSKESSLSALFLPIVSPIVDLVDDLMANPMTTVLDLLPRLARALNFNLVTKSIQNFLSKSSLLAGMASSIDLSADAVNNMIDGKTFSFDIGKYLTATITLKAIDWVKLAGCGSLELADSVSAANAYRVDIKADRPAVSVLMDRYIVRLIFTTKIAGKSTTVDLAA